jgi:hypothetical protein
LDWFKAIIYNPTTTARCKFLCFSQLYSPFSVVMYSCLYDKDRFFNYELGLRVYIVTGVYRIAVSFAETFNCCRADKYIFSYEEYIFFSMTYKWFAKSSRLLNHVKMEFNGELMFVASFLNLIFIFRSVGATFPLLGECSGAITHVGDNRSTYIS